MATKELRSLTKKPQAQAYVTLRSDKYSETLEIGDHLTIGRDTGNLLKVIDNFASSRHARIDRTPYGFVLRDLRSRNGTYVNGAQILEARLNDQDRIVIGAAHIHFHLRRDRREHLLMENSKNPAWQRELERLEAFGQSELPVLILGGSGTGKEGLARSLHRHSPRAYGAFVSVNCSALSESLVESELFGHVRGSFTGATQDRQGAFESARGGTLFLDEIGDLPLNIQPKLLRALENNEIKPVGGDRPFPIDVRIIAATHQDLPSRVACGDFRSDLYFRLNVLQLNPPPLTQRLEDFEDLFYHFARLYRVRFSNDGIQALKQHSWPGNIRELRNLVARAAVVFRPHIVTAQEIHELIDRAIVHTPRMGAPAQATTGESIPVLKEIEKRLIAERLSANGGNQRQTALELGMPKSTLNDRVRAYGLRA